MGLNKGIWDPKPKVTNIKGTNLKSLTYYVAECRASSRGIRVQGLGIWGFCPDSTLNPELKQNPKLLTLNLGV